MNPDLPLSDELEFLGMEVMGEMSPCLCLPMSLEDCWFME